MAATEWPTKTTSRKREGVADLEDVGRVALQRLVPIGVVRGQVRAAGTDVVEADGLEVSERRRDVPPHLLITAVAMGEQHRLAACGTADHHVVPFHDAHACGP